MRYAKPFLLAVAAATLLLALAPASEASGVRVGAQRFVFRGRVGGVGPGAAFAFRQRAFVGGHSFVAPQASFVFRQNTFVAPQQALYAAPQASFQSRAYGYQAMQLPAFAPAFDPGCGQPAQLPAFAPAYDPCAAQLPAASFSFGQSYHYSHGVGAGVGLPAQLPGAGFSFRVRGRF